MADSVPTKAEIGEYRSVDPTESNPEITSMPWIDIHQHTQSLSWNDREAFDISGCRAAVMVAASYYWSPYRPVQASDVRFLWDDAIRRTIRFDDAHQYQQYLAVGIHTWSRVENAEALLAVLPEYCELDRVVAIGETGIDASQHTCQWALDEQREVVAEQLRVADTADLPAIIHTPGGKDTVRGRYREYYEELDADFPETHFDPETAKCEAVRHDLDIINEVGIAEDSVVIDHADNSVIGLVLEPTDCYLGFSVGSPWFRGVDAELVAAAIRKYGSDRLIVDTDMLGAMKHDPYTMKRLVLDLYRVGISESDIRTVVYENPKQLLDI